MDNKNYLFFPFSRTTAESINDEWSREEKGFLIELLIKYAFDIGEPETPQDRAIKAVYRVAKKDIDNSIEKFIEKALKGRYAAYCKNCKDDFPLPFEDWKEGQREI